LIQEALAGQHDGREISVRELKKTLNFIGEALKRVLG
jgi:hypothetical protein